jgi:glycerol kinase
VGRGHRQTVANAIVWQDTRTDRLIATLAADGGPDRFRARCGLPLATYFSGRGGCWTPTTTCAAERRRASFVSAPSTRG